MVHDRRVFVLEHFLPVGVVVADDGVGVDVVDGGHFGHDGLVFGGVEEFDLFGGILDAVGELVVDRRAAFLTF